jgi:hypothetical protein
MVGVDSIFTTEATSCVTNALNSDVGVGVDGKGRGVGVPISAGVSVTKTSGCTDAVSGIPPRGVGVWYCPHNDALPMQEDIKKDARVEKMMIRFTKSPLERLYL